MARLEQPGAHLRGAGVEEHVVFGVGERGVEVGGPARDVVLFGQPFNLVAIAADDDRVDDQPVAIGERDAALVADRQDRAHQMLVVAHAAGHAMHDQPQPPLGHPTLPASVFVTAWLLRYTSLGWSRQAGAGA